MAITSNMRINSELLWDSLMDIAKIGQGVDGLSHNEAEEITPDWAAAGTNVLFHAVVETAGIVD